MSKNILNILEVIFLDNFYFTTGICVVLLAGLVLRRFSDVDYSYSLAILNWFVLSAAAIVVFSILAIDFFSHQSGLDRLTLIPSILGASPLLICALIATFFDQKISNFKNLKQPFILHISRLKHENSLLSARCNYSPLLQCRISEKWCERMRREFERRFS